VSHVILCLVSIDLFLKVLHNVALDSLSHPAAMSPLTVCHSMHIVSPDCLSLFESVLLQLNKLVHQPNLKRLLFLSLHNHQLENFHCRSILAIPIGVKTRGRGCEF